MDNRNPFVELFLKDKQSGTYKHGIYWKTDTNPARVYKQPTTDSENITASKWIRDVVGEGTKGNFKAYSYVKNTSGGLVTLDVALVSSGS